MFMEFQIGLEIGITHLKNGVEVSDGAKSQTKETPN